MEIKFCCYTKFLIHTNMYGVEVRERLGPGRLAMDEIVQKYGVLPDGFYIIGETGWNNLQTGPFVSRDRAIAWGQMNHPEQAVGLPEVKVDPLELLSVELTIVDGELVKSQE